MEFRYTDYEAANIMLGYLNVLRESVGVEKLQLDTTLIEKAKIQVQKYSETGKYNSIGISANYVDGGNSIRHHFEKWKAGNGYNNMVNSSFKYFGYALCRNPHASGGNSHYGIQYFWDSK